MSDESKKEGGTTATPPADAADPGPQTPPASTAEGADPAVVAGASDRQAADEAAERAFEESAPGGQVAVEEELDPELMRLPRPRRRRHPLIALLVIGLSLYLMYFVKDDFIFFLQPRQAADLGGASQALKQGRLRHNLHVSLAGAPDRKHALILEARFGGYESFFRLLQTENRLFVQQHRETRASDETLSGGYSGQLIKFRALPYRKSLETYFNRTMTVAHDLDFAALARAKAAGGGSARDQSGATVALTPGSVFWVNVAYPDEWVLQASKRHYPSLAEVRRLLEGVELAVAPDEEASASFWRLVLKADPEGVQILMSRLRNPDLHASLVRRQVSYSARWEQLEADGQTLIINAADPTAPSRYQAQPGPDGQPRLVPVKETPARVPAEAVLFISTSSPLQIPADAFVLLSGKRPGENWYYAVLYLVLLGFIAINAATLVQRLRERRRPG